MQMFCLGFFFPYSLFTTAERLIKICSPVIINRDLPHVMVSVFLLKDKQNNLYKKKGTKYNKTPCLISPTADPIEKVLKLAGITALTRRFKLEMKSFLWWLSIYRSRFTTIYTTIC